MDATTLVTPFVKEAVASATKLHEQAKGSCRFQVEQVEDVVFEKIREVTLKVPGGVKTTERSAFDEPNNLACSGLDHLTTSIPDPTRPTGELVSATIEATISKASGVSDYVASFWIVRAGLKGVDSGLSITEKILHRMEPVRYTKPAIAYIRGVRHFLRAVRQEEGLRQPAITGILDMVAEKEGLRQPAASGIHGMAAEDVHVETRMEKMDVEASYVDDDLDSIIDACADMDMHRVSSLHCVLSCTCRPAYK